MTKNKHVYEKRVVFFIDILAFKYIVEKSGKPVSYIIDVLDKIKEIINNEYEKNSVEVTTFSDSVIISFAYNEPSQLFFELIYILHLQFELFGQYGILVRGACAIGDAVHTKEYVFGPAVNKAYLLESSCAVYPRVIISSDIIEECANYSMHRGHNEKEDILELLKKDTDGYYYIDYFGYEVVDSEMDCSESWGIYMHTIKENILNGIKNEKDIKINQKYLWLKEKYNNALSQTLIDNYKKSDIHLSKIQ